MKINVLHVKKEIGSQQPFEFRIPAEQLLAERDLKQVHGEVYVTGQVTNTGCLLEIAGTVQTECVSSVCDRCLEDFTWSLKTRFVECFRSEDDEPQDDDEDIRLYKGDEIDIDDLAADSIVVAMPIKTVCNEDCRGLCPQCGVNRNETSCACTEDTCDPRLAKLQQYFNKS